MVSDIVIDSSIPKKSSLAKRIFLGYGKFCCTIAKGTVKVFKSPKTRQIMSGIGRSTEYMVTGKPPSNMTNQTNSKKSSTSNTKSSRKDIHVHIHIDKDGEVEE